MTVKEYNQCVDQYSDNIYRFILKNIKDEDKAKDVVQDTYEKLWVRADSVSFNKVRSYLFSTAYHTMIDLIRREKKYTGMEEINQGEHVYENQYKGLNEVLEDALKKLPDIQRSVVLLRDYEGYTYKEIAGITGLSESQVKVYIYRARVTLKKHSGSVEKVI